MFGSSDLDTRPPGMYRRSMEYWLQRCPNCNFVAESLAKTTELPKDFLTTKEYLDFGDHFPKDKLIETFLFKARISGRIGDWQTAFWDYLAAAWVADDKDITNCYACLARSTAVKASLKNITNRYACWYRLFECLCYIFTYLKCFCWHKKDADDHNEDDADEKIDYDTDTYWIKQARLEALNAYDKIPNIKRNNMLQIVRADLLRKTEQFDRLINEYAEVQFSENILNQVVAFEIEKAKLKDTKTYTVADVVPADAMPNDESFPY